MNLSSIPNCKNEDYKWRLKVIGFKDSCEICGGRDVLECHHIVGRADRKLRWDPDNGILVDRKCHQRPDLILVWLAENQPARYERLMRKKNELHHGQKLGKAPAA